MDKGKTFNLNLPDEMHGAIREWCFRNKETVMEFCRTATIHRMHKEGIKPLPIFTPIVPISPENEPENEVRYLSNMEEARIKYPELLLEMPTAQPGRKYGGTIRVRIRGDHSKVESVLFFIPPQESIAHARAWREKYMGPRQGYVTISRCALFLLPPPLDTPGEFA